MVRTSFAAAHAACLLGFAGASLSDRVAESMRIPSNRTATFGDFDAGWSHQPRGTIMFKVGNERSDSRLFQAVQWTTSGITIPKALVREVCGDLPDSPSFTYSVNSKWGHGSRRSSATGPELCGDRFTGGHWDPSAACSKYSGNPACDICETQDGYSCDAGKFDPKPDAMGSFAYRFLNKNACELGDLSGMHGELQPSEAIDCQDHDEQCSEWERRGECTRNAEHMAKYCQRSCNVCGAAHDSASSYVPLRSLTENDKALAQMSIPFGEISKPSVSTSLIGINCDASGPPAAHATNCGCLRFHGESDPSVGTLTVFKPWQHETFYMSGPGMDQLEGRSIVVQCGSAFGEVLSGTPLFCAAIE